MNTPALRAFAVRRTPSIEGNKTGASVFAFTARSARIIPLYEGVARSAGVVASVHFLKKQLEMRLPAADKPLALRASLFTVKQTFTRLP
ncbi:MAG: hypothetical protein LBI31_02690 [Zoogloeaceae bacterium]|nr:hypothetical protein [Zoogloeaceae bacterium]